MTDGETSDQATGLISPTSSAHAPSRDRVVADAGSSASASVADGPGQTVERRPDLFVLTTATRCLQGFATLAAFWLAATECEFSMDRPGMWWAVVTATWLCGAAGGSIVERSVALRLGRRVANAMITAIICVGLSLLLAVSVSQSAEAGVILLTAFVIGPGTGAVWNSASRLAGDAVGPRMRWQGMRICNAAFPVGMFLAVAALSASPVGGLSVTVAVSVVVSLFWLTRREFVEPPMATVEVRNGEPDMAERVPETAPASDAQDEAAPEEGECCGGAVRAFIPVSFWHGVLIAGVGLLALTLPVSALVFRAMLQHSGTAALALTGGICVGFWLMFSVAPKAGYAVTMLPFLTLSIPLVFVAETASGAGPGFVAACAFSGVALGGVILGSAAVISEQFADARDGSGLTRVLVVASFQTAMVLLGIGLLQQFVTDERVSAALHCFVFVLGILVIRSVPSPVLSSAGIDDDSEDTKNELQDVIAAIRD